MAAPAEHKKAKRNATRGVPLKTARQIAELGSGDGDWTLAKLAAEITAPKETSSKTKAGKREEEMRLILVGSLKDAQALLHRAEEQSAEITKHANGIKTIGKRGIPADLRQRAITLAELIAKTDLVQTVRGAAQAGLMTGLRYMTLKTIQEWPKPSGAREKTAMWDLLREVAAERPNDNIGLIYSAASKRYEKRNRQGPKFLSVHTVLKYFRQQGLRKA